MVQKLGIGTAFGLVIMSLLWNSINQAAEDPAPKSRPTRRVESKTLGGEKRFLTHLSTDKQIYRAGEKVYLRGVILHHISHLPTTQNLPALIQIKGPKGDTVGQGVTKSQDSVVGFAWSIPQGQPGGEYSLHVSLPTTGDAPATRKFEIREYRPPRLKSQIKFLRDGYGPGDQVVAILNTERAEGGIPVGAKVSITARVDGKEVFRGGSKVDSKGQCISQFALPKEITHGEGSIAMVVEDGGVVETAAKTLPILLQTVDLNAYPEGGSLVAGVRNRVYLEAFTPAKKPADLKGVVLDSDGNQVSEFETKHEGRGRFEFRPVANQSYELQINEPAGITSTFKLPGVETRGVAIQSIDEVFEETHPIVVRLATPIEGEFVVTLRKHEKEVGVKHVALKAARETLCSFDAVPYDGVLTLTVWDKEDRPISERLVFVRPKSTLSIQITADKEKYTPGDKAKIQIKTAGDDGKPISAVVGVTITDDAVNEILERREHAPSLPVMVLLENEVRDLADAHIYLDPENEWADEAVDLLLGTQGWRRFSLIDVAAFIKQHADAARQALAIRVPVPPTSTLFGIDGDADGAWSFRMRRFGRQRVSDFARRPEHEAVPVDAFFLVEQEAKVDDSFVRGEADRLLFEQVREIPEARFMRRLSLNQTLARQKMFLPIRIFAHKRKNRQPNQRTDFTETLFWSAAIKTDSAGYAEIEVDLNDSITSFKVQADAFSQVGTLGSSVKMIESVEPFYVEPKLPLEVSSGDFLQIPLSLVNATSSHLEEGVLQIVSDSWKSIESDENAFHIQPNQRERKILGVRVGSFNGDADLTLSAKIGPYEDKVTRKLIVKPLGFPIDDSRGGLIDPNSIVRHTIAIPKSVVPGSLSCQFSVHPTPLSQLHGALAGLIREPHGCFEQSSSSIFPLVMAQQYFLSHEGVDPLLVSKSEDVLGRGYEKLIGFECKDRGFEWFGKNPGHDALSAYGLLEFTEMARVRNVDANMIKRTRDWLLEQRDGQGGYRRRAHTLHTWISDPECANTYNTWALLEAGVKVDLAAEIDWVKKIATTTQNSYVLALSANVLSFSKHDEAYQAACEALADLQSDDGSVSGAITSVVGSSGNALTIETTALALIAWLKDPGFTKQVERAIKFVSESCKAGRFGSTQSTVLALRAIVEYDQARATPRAPGVLRMMVDGRPVGKAVSFTKDRHEAINLADLSGLLTPGEHLVEVSMSKGSRMPYSLDITYNNVTPDNSDQCKISISTELSQGRINEGEIAEIKVRVGNHSDKKVPNPIAMIGIPGGLEVRHDQLKELVKEERIASYEVIGREVILYWRSFLPKQNEAFSIQTVAAVPGKYSGPASRAYLYYGDEHKSWVEPVSIEIVPRKP